MKKYISILLVIFMIISMTACQSNSKGNTLSIPSKGQEYYKKVICESDGGDVIAQFTNSYLTVFYNGENLVFDRNAELVYDGSNGSLSSAKTYGNQVLCEDKYLIDLTNGNKKEFFSGYRPLDYKNGYWVVGNTNGRGIIDDNGKEIIPCQYDTITTFDDKDCAIVSIDDKYGMINKENDVVIPLHYKAIFPFHDGAGNEDDKYFNDYGTTYDYTLVLDNNENAFTIDRKGNKIFNLGDFGYDAVCSGATLYNNLIPVEKDGLYGFIDMQGNAVVPLKYNDIKSDFINGYACVAIGENYGVIDMKGETVIEFDYAYISPFDQKGLAIARLKDNTNEDLIIDLAGNIAYKTTKGLEALGGGFFKENNNIIFITTDNSN